jgi:hypothetical protein
MGYQPKFKPSNNYLQIQHLLNRKQDKLSASTLQELEQFMQPTNKNLVPSYNSLRNRLIKKQIMTEIPVLFQKF